MLLGLSIWTEAPAIEKAAWITGPSVARYRQAEMRVQVRGTFKNPFDPREASLDAVISCPSGKSLTLPGFWYQAYKRRLGPGTRPIAVPSTQAVRDGKAAGEERFDNGELLDPDGAPEWRIRFSPMEAGVHKVTLVWRTSAGIARKVAQDLVATPGKGGFVRVSRRDPRYFALDDGSSFWPIGANICWGGARGTFDFDDWIPSFAANGANWGRLWLSPHWTTFALERPGQGLGKYDLGNAWRLDYVLQLAEKYGMRMSLCVESYNILRDRVSWPEWERSPLNKLLGGPLARPTDFWADSESARLFRMKLRYLAARYGAKPSVMSWEFWNEVDGTSGYAVQPIAAWHAEMGRALKQMDPYRHLVTTSFGGHGASAGDEKVFGLKEIDFSQTHSYEAPDIPFAIATANRRFGSLGKPHFVGEVGADTTGPRAENDPDGMQLRDPAWAALAVGDAGAAMPWWWDSYIHPRKLSRLFRPLREFTKDIQFDREAFRSVVPDFQNRGGMRDVRRKDILIPVSTPGFAPSHENKPRTLRVTKNGVDDRRPLSPLQQGTGNHPELHNPVTFEIDLPWPTKLVAEVGDVSGYGGAAISMKLDGKEVLSKAFPDPNGDRITDTLKEFAGDYTVAVPAGRHVVTVSNPGQDWFTVSFRIVGAREQAGPPLVGWAQVGKSTALAWVRLEERTWRSTAIQAKRVPPADPSWLILPLAPGRWRAEVWDTDSGRVLATSAVDKGRVALPRIETDVAVKLRRD